MNGGRYIAHINNVTEFTESKANSFSTLQTFVIIKEGLNPSWKGPTCNESLRWGVIWVLREPCIRIFTMILIQIKYYTTYLGLWFQTI